MSIHFPILVLVGWGHKQKKKGQKMQPTKTRIEATELLEKNPDQICSLILRHLHDSGATIEISLRDLNIEQLRVVNEGLKFICEQLLGYQNRGQSRIVLTDVDRRYELSAFVTFATTYDIPVEYTENSSDYKIIPEVTSSISKYDSPDRIDYIIQTISKNLH
ncbi:hypothetical protein DRJ17_03735 [Candidatus Woesearchaeota archaeon]|nr:MAG: hypothetical protein DRJ17_03735 [Candidatus Woesearchaeota archaeon]